MQGSFDFEAIPVRTSQFLCVVRHGEYYGSHLDDGGRRTVNDLGRTLKLRFQGLRVVLLTSPIIRAIESAQILGGHLGVEPIVELCLEATGESLDSWQVKEALRLYDQKSPDFEVVIFCTHLPFIDDFPTLWAETQGFLIPEGRNRSKGSAILIDVLAEKWEHIRGQ